MFKDRESKHKYYFSLLCILKDEDDYLDEFIQYYLYHGIDHFYFYDNGSQTPVRETLKDYLSYCTIIDFPGKAMQMPAYRHWLKTYKHETQWVAVFDIDEFILPHKHETFRDFVQEMESKGYVSVTINWKMFGFGGHLYQSKQRVTQSYTYSHGKQFIMGKPLMNASYIEDIPSPHKPKLLRGKQTVNAHGVPFEGEYLQDYSHGIIQLNHYFTKSLQEFWQKINSLSVIGTVRAKEDNEWIYRAPFEYSVERDTMLWGKYAHIFANDTSSQQNLDVIESSSSFSKYYAYKPDLKVKPKIRCTDETDLKRLQFMLERFLLQPKNNKEAFNERAIYFYDKAIGEIRSFL